MKRLVYLEFECDGKSLACGCCFFFVLYTFVRTYDGLCVCFFYEFIPKSLETHKMMKKEIEKNAVFSTHDDQLECTIIQNLT